MKYSQMKRFLMEHKDSMKPPYISTLDGILTAGGELIGYQELEMDSPYLDVHEDTSYTKDYVTLHSHEFYELLFCRSGNLQYLIGNTRILPVLMLKQGRNIYGNILVLWIMQNMPVMPSKKSVIMLILDMSLAETS